MYAYKQLALGTYDTPIAMMADQLPMPPFWAYVGKSGKRVAVVDVPFAKPVKKLNGIQVTNWGGHDLWCHERSSWPVELIDDLTQRFGDYPVPHCDDAIRSSDNYEDLRLGLIAGIKKKTALLRHCLNMEDWDFFFGVLSESHCAGHQFWHFMDPSHPRYNPDAPERMRHCVRDIYAAIDAGIGELIACLAPATDIMLVFSHGMGPYYHGSHLPEEIIDRLEFNEVGPEGTPAHTTKTKTHCGPAAGSFRSPYAKASRRKFPGIGSKRFGAGLTLTHDRRTPGRTSGFFSFPKAT